MKVEIIKSGINGEGIGYIQNKPVFVQGALLNEEVDISIVEKNKTYSIGKIEKIIKKSPHRVQPKCRCYHDCKACSGMIADYELQCMMKEDNLKQSLRKYAAVHPKLIQKIVKSEEVYGYRNACKLPLREEDGQLVTGMFQPNSNYFTPIDSCIIHEKGIEIIRKQVLKILNEDHYSAYNYHTKKGMRSLVIRQIGKQAQVTLITGEDEIAPYTIERIMRIPNVISLWQSVHTQKKTVEIFGNKMIPLSDKRFLEFDLKGVHIKLSPRSFFQLNTKQANVMYDLISKEVGKVNLCVEAYSGIGGISFTLKDQAKEIIGIESVKDAVINANMSAKENHLDHIHFICDDAAHKLEYISKKREIDCLVVDPPRVGLDDLMIQTILKSRIKKLIYVSCNPATLGKNLAFLQQRYNVKKVIPVDMFPQTAQVESICVLTRK